MTSSSSTPPLHNLALLCSVLVDQTLLVLNLLSCVLSSTLHPPVHIGLPRVLFRTQLSFFSSPKIDSVFEKFIDPLNQVEDYCTAWKRDLLILDGESEAKFPISNRTMRFQRKNSADPQNQLLLMTEYLTERLIPNPTTSSPSSFPCASGPRLLLGGLHLGSSSSGPSSSFP